MSAPFKIRIFAASSLVLLAFACGGEKNAADCGKKTLFVKCTPRTDDENARIALNAGDYSTAIDLFQRGVDAHPEEYSRYPLLAAAYAGRAGVSIIDLAKSQLSRARGSGSSDGSASSGGGGFFEQISNFLPSPSELGDDAYRQALTDVASAVDALNTIPAALRSTESGASYAASASLQLTLYQSIYSVMYLNLFAINAASGNFDPAQLSSMTEEDATVVVSGLEAAAEAQAQNDPALQAQINAAIAQINSADGTSNKDRLAAFLAARNAAAAGSGSGSSVDSGVGSVANP